MRPRALIPLSRLSRHLPFGMLCDVIEDSIARRARYVLYLLGAAFVALGFSLELVPALAAIAPALAGRICAGIGAAILSVGRFGSDRLVRRCDALLRGTR